VNSVGAAQCKYGRNLLDFVVMPGSTYQIQSQQRGPHWIAWVSRDGSGKPDRSVIVIGETQEEAEANARRWAESGV